MIVLRRIPSFPDYNASNDGRIFHKNGSALRIGKTSDGYPRVVIKKNKKVFYRTVHVLVCEAFNGLRPKGYDVCHNDGSKDNNEPSNLRYDTRKNNCLDAVKHGTTNRGERQWYHRLTEQDVIDIRRKWSEGHSNASLAKEYKVYKSNISKVVNWQSWKHVPLSPSGTDK